jgi:hypothetical protein
MENVSVKKLTLDLGALKVESFDPSPSLQDQRGTVKAQTGGVNPWDTCGFSCGPGSCYHTCEPCDGTHYCTWYCTQDPYVDTCAVTCDHSCYGSCDYGATCGGETCPPYCDEM